MIVGSEPECTLGNYARPTDWPTDRWKGDKCSNGSVGSETKFTFSKLWLTNRPTNQPMDRTIDRLSHREGDNRRISTRETLNFVRGIGSPSNFVNLWEFSKKFHGKKNILTSMRFRQYGLVFGQYRLAIWPIPVGDLANTGWWFGQYRLAIWPIPVGDLANTGWRFGQYRLAISPIPAKVHFRRFGQVRGRNRRF